MSSLLRVILQVDQNELTLNVLYHTVSHKPQMFKLHNMYGYKSTLLHISSWEWEFFFSFGRPTSECLVFQTLVTVELIITGQEFELKFLLGCKELTPNILVSMVNILNSNPILVRTEQVIAKLCFARSNKKKNKKTPNFFLF